MAHIKTELHPRNKHQNPYDFNELIQSCPELAPFVFVNLHGNASIDFSNPKAVRALNKALLKSFYHIDWDIPERYLCPPIPGRADYIHYIADLLCSSHKGIIPKGPQVKVLDIGVGANCIYPLIGYREYGWSFVGTDIDPGAVASAQALIQRNSLDQAIEIRLQKSPSHIFEGVVDNRYMFDISLCNPPFYSSQAEAQAATKRKWKNLGIKTNRLNFGGQSHELWCQGGEVAFIKQMIQESVHAPCKWFSTLVSKQNHLPEVYKMLNTVQATEIKTIPMGQGEKKSRIVAWRFIDS